MRHGRRVFHLMVFHCKTHNMNLSIKKNQNMDFHMTLARKMAAFVRETVSVPTTTRDMAINAVVDLTIAAVAGAGTRAALSARTAAQSIWGAGPSPVWFAGYCLPPCGAAFSNAVSASALDLDDGHRAAAGHPGASVIPSVVAEAATVDINTDRVLTAIAIGYEIAIRVAASRDLRALDTLVSGRWCGLGAAAAVGWLRGLSVEEIEQAIALAGASAPGLTAVAYSNVMGNHLKEGIGWATATGYAAVDLAARGFTAPIDIFDNDELYDRDMLVGAAGGEWYLDGVYFKPYSCCRWAHAPIDAVLAIVEREALSPEDIGAITVHTFSRTLQLDNEPAPKTIEGAQYSVPFCAALAAVHGVDAVVRMNEDHLGDPHVLSLSARVDMVADPELDAMFPGAVPGRVEIRTRKGCFERVVLAPKGEPANPLTRTDLVDKFHRATMHMLTADQQSQFAEAFAAAFDGDVSAVFSAHRRLRLA